MSNVVIMAGGTGGHVIPALVVAERLQRDDITVSWIGTADGIESRLVPAANIAMDIIQIVGFRKKGLTQKLMMPFMLMRALWQSVKVLRRRKPKMVLGMGGFVSGPGGLAARILRIPIVLHEQNSVAGMTNQWLSKVAHKVFTGFAEVKGFSGDYEWVGNPVYARIAAVAETAAPKAENALRVLVVGGSQGARIFNHYLPEKFAALETTVEIWHQCGRNNQAEVEKAYQNAGFVGAVNVDEFIQDMAAAYAWADIVICRAGAMTVSEICMAGSVALFVPYAFAVSDHQTENAMSLVRRDAALMLSEQAFKQVGEFNRLFDRLQDVKLREQMAMKAKAMAKPDAAENIAQECMRLIHA